MMPGEPLSGKCDLFQQSLTSNSLCLSFNTEKPSNIWSDDMSFAKALKEIGATKPTNISNFRGTGPNEGRNSSCLFSTTITFSKTI